MPKASKDLKHVFIQYKGAVQVARRSDMDMNGHINNVTYVAWALETVPIDVYLNYTLVQVIAWHLKLINSPFGRKRTPPVHLTASRNALKHQRQAHGSCSIQRILPRLADRSSLITDVCALQTETDFKAECMAGDTIESLASKVEEDTNGTGVVR